MAREGARWVVGGPDDRELAAPGEVDERIHAGDVVRCQDIGLHAVGAVQQRLVPFDLEGIDGVA